MEDHELKKSLVNMLKGGIDDAKLASTIISSNPDLVPLKDVWYNINDYITPDTIKYVELYCKEDNHDKVYIITEVKTYHDNIIVYYGRRGKKLVKKDKKKAI